MANKTKAQLIAELQDAGIPQRGFSIDQFCGRWNLSGTMYGAMKKKGIGPRETKILDKIIITIESESEWIEARTADTAA